jgi:hypothetical protein
MIAISMPPELEIKFREKVKAENLSISKAGITAIEAWIDSEADLVTEDV